MDGDDLKYAGCEHPDSYTLVDVLEENKRLAAEIERLRAELAARDAEIAAWLRALAHADKLQIALGAIFVRTHAWEIAEDLATAIASGEYRKGEG